jgi:hypothetical protein
MNIDGNVYDNVIRRNNQHQEYVGYGGSKSKASEIGFDNKRA